MGNGMNKALLFILTAALAFSVGSCLPSYGAEAEDHFWRGIESRQEGKSDLAMEEFTKAIELNPDYDLAYYNRALLYYFDRDLARSLEDYSKALELSPDNPYWTYERGFIHAELGHREEAIADLERALDLGLVGSDKQRVEDALAQLRQ
jgi:tetratricopeptide (TPR) repeat protein